MKTHDPLPWHNGGSAPDGAEFKTFFISSPPNRIAACSSKENAAFILRACNSHEGLLKALKAVMEVTVNDWGSGDAFSIARAAIARAEGRQE